jgi:Glycine zipper 2TM domain
LDRIFQQLLRSTLNRNGAYIMIKKTIATLIAAATLATGFAAVPAEARHGRDRGYDQDDGYYNYDNRAVVGGLAGREIARRGNKTEGAIIGAAVGALGGRAIDKADSNCRRRYR